MKKYKVRPGTIDFGKEYEFKMVALLCLRCLSAGAEDMWCASNADTVGAFDDIVLHLRKPGQKGITYAMQLKHKDNPKNITRGELLAAKGDFSLVKYCHDMAELKQSMESVTKSGIVGDLGEFDDIHFVLFSNRNVVSKLKFLERICDNSNTIGMLNTNSSQDVYRINFKNVTCDTNIIGADCCNNLYLIPNQIHARHLDELIGAEIRKITLINDLTQVNIRNAVDKLVKYVSAWALGKLGGHYYLTKQDIVNKLSQTLFSQYELDLTQQQYGCTEKLVWSRTIRNKTITIVEANETIKSFLKSYIGSEIKPYIKNHETFWADNLSEQSQNIFYQKNNSLKTHMLRAVGSEGKITAYDVYKCCWLDAKLPLLVEINTLEDYANVIQILKFSGYNLRLIVMKKAPLALPPIESIPRPFVTMLDLSFEDRCTILNCSVKLQGRGQVSLRSLVDETIFNQIKCSDIIRILENDFSIGADCPVMSDCFMERYLLKVFIKSEAFYVLSDEVFLIQKGPNCSGLEFVHGGQGNVFFVEDDCGDMAKNRGPVVHRLVWHLEGCYEWKESIGSVKNIRRFQLTIEDYLENEQKFVWSYLEELDTLIKPHNNVLNPVRIISAAPGMGKSTLLDYVATETPADVWVLRVNLHEHHGYYEKLKRVKPTASDYLTHFNDAILRKHNCKNLELAQAVFNKLLAQSQILVLLDGFDEISISYKDEVTDIAKSLQAADFRVWLTTRQVMATHLEDQLHVISTLLHPLTVNQQLTFLTKYFHRISMNMIGCTSSKSRSEPNPLVGEFVLKLYKAARDNLNDKFCEFTEIPLQNVLLADVFTKEFETCLKTGVVGFSDQFDLLYLYEEFINRKNDILCDKFGNVSKDMRQVFRKHQQLFALKFLFSARDLRELDLDRQLEEYSQQTHNIQFLQREGIVMVEEVSTAGSGDGFAVSFIHRTFAEYLAAQWLSENVSTDNGQVKYCVRKLVIKQFEEYCLVRPFLYKILDCMLARNCSLHLSVIHGQTDDVETLVKTNPDCLHTCDAGGRTILHLIPLYVSTTHRLLKIPTTDKDKKLIKIIEQIPNDKITNTKDLLLQYNPLDYALANCSFIIANKLCEKSDALKISINIHQNDNTYCNSCAALELKPLFKRLLPYIVCRDLLLWQKSKTSPIESYCEISDSPELSKKLREYSEDFGVTTIWELFHAEDLNDIRFTVAFGTKDLLRFLISKGAKVNQRDVYNNTPLHYASSHDRFGMLKLLLAEGADVNASGRGGYTPLHHAAFQGNHQITKVLMSRGADINKTNNAGNTPLHVSLEFREDDISKLLLSKNAKFNLQNNAGCLPLHYATEGGYAKIVSLLLEKAAGTNADINAQNEDGATPLHMSVKSPILLDKGDVQRQVKIVQLLLDNGAKVNQQDAQGHTALTRICKRSVEEGTEMFCSAVVKMLLNKGADVDLINHKGKTALDLALEKGKYEIVSLLQQRSNDELSMGVAVKECVLL